MRRRPWGLLLVVVVGTVGLTAPTARAQDRTPSRPPSEAATAETSERGETRGVGIDLAAISVDDRLTPGGSYRLPPLRVRNPDEADTTYQMSVRPGGDHLPAPAGWVTFTPANFALGGSAEQVVEVEVVVPPGALDGHYSGLLAAGIVEGDGVPGAAGARVGAAAATRLDFQVAPASLLSGWMNAIRRWTTGTAPWSWLGLGGAMLAGLLSLLSRRFHVRVERVVR